MGITRSSFRGENKTEKPLGVMVTGTKLLHPWPLEKIDVAHTWNSNMLL